MQPHTEAEKNALLEMLQSRAAQANVTLLNDPLDVQLGFLDPDDDTPHDPNCLLCTLYATHPPQETEKKYPGVNRQLRNIRPKKEWLR